MKKTGNIKKTDYKFFYHEIIDYFFKNILSQYDSENQKLPSVREIVKKFNISIPTIKIALNYLRKKNYIYSRKGIGVFYNQEIPKFSYIKEKIKTIYFVIPDKFSFQSDSVFNVNIFKILNEIIYLSVIYNIKLSVTTINNLQDKNIVSCPQDSSFFFFTGYMGFENYYSRLMKKTNNFLVYTSTRSDINKVNSIFFDIKKTISDKICSLLESGEKVAFIGGADNNIINSERYEGYRDGFHRAGIKINKKLVFPVTIQNFDAIKTSDRAYNAIKKNIFKDYTVIFCPSFLLIDGIIKAFTENNIAEKKILCLDDSVAGRYFYKNIETFKWPFDKLAIGVFEVILKIVFIKENTAVRYPVPIDVL